VSELAKRWAVAVVAIPLVFLFGYRGGWTLAVPLAGFAGWAAHECYRLAARKEVRPLGPIGSATAAGLVLMAALRPTFATFAPFALALIGVSAMVTVVSAMVVRGPGERPLAATSITLFGAIYAGLSLSFMPLLHALPTALNWGGGSSPAWSGFLVLTLPLVATWVGDASALFAGTAWGKAKLAPTISPNKSWVGFCAELGGGAVAGVVWVLFAGPYLPNLAQLPVAVFACLGALLGLAAVIGDLVESLLKREAGVKDSGTFFPGHGGVIDRIDSLMFTIPTAYWALVVLGTVQ
jgi:phosphatidate cytidylyltransferase